MANDARPAVRRSTISPVDFAAVNRAALGRLPDILARWLPGGRLEAREYVVRNPKRQDRRPGSFKVNLDTGRWADFATGDKGGDPISLTAFLAGCSQVEAARHAASRRAHRDPGVRRGRPYRRCGGLKAVQGVRGRAR